MPTRGSGAAKKADGGGHAPLPSGTARAQWRGGGSRRVIGLAKEEVHKTLLDVQTQLLFMQEKVEVLIWCVEEDCKTGLGDGYGLGLSYEALGKLKDPEGKEGRFKEPGLGYKQTSTTRTGPGPSQMGLLVGLQEAGPNSRVGTQPVWRVRGSGEAGPSIGRS